MGILDYKENPPSKRELKRRAKNFAFLYWQCSDEHLEYMFGMTPENTDKITKKAFKKQKGRKRRRGLKF